jgi:hypothetical protein
MHLPTSDPPDSRTSADHVEAALEASCDTLVALQVMSAFGADKIPGAEGQTALAISSLRLAIAELRAAQQRRGSGIAAGFVLAARDPSDGDASPLAQSRPRRTA